MCERGLYNRAFLERMGSPLVMLVKGLVLLKAGFGYLLVTFCIRYDFECTWFFKLKVFWAIIHFFFRDF